MQIRMRKVHDRGARGVDRQEPHIPRVALEPFKDAGRARIGDRHEHEPEARCERTSEVDCQPP